MADRPTYVWSGSEWDAVADPGAVRKALVNAKGDLIGATADNTPAILTAGSNGQMLMADSSATAGLRYVDPPANRRLTINGDMQVHQRGTSVTGIITDSYRTADRWNTGVNTGTWTQTIETDSPSGSGLRKSLKMLCTTANASPSASGEVFIEQRFEGQDLQRIKKGTASAEQLSLSFWVKSNVTGTYAAWLFDVDNTRQTSRTYTISSSNSWERKVLTFPADSTGAFDNDNAGSLYLRIYLVAGSNFTSGSSADWQALSGNDANRAPGQVNLAAATNNYWQITGVQFETGPVATPFEFEPYEATLRKCQRYYYRVQGTGAFTILGGVGYGISSTAATTPFMFPTTMRAEASSVEFSNVRLANQAETITVTAAALSWRTDSQAFVDFTVASGITTNRVYVAQGNNNASAHVSFNAEL